MEKSRVESWHSLFLDLTLARLLRLNYWMHQYLQQSATSPARSTDPPFSSTMYICSYLIHRKPGLLWRLLNHLRQRSHAGLLG